MRRKSFGIAGFSVCADLVRPIIYARTDNLAGRIFLIGEFISTEIQHLYAAGLLERMIENELKQLLWGVELPDKKEALKRVLTNVKTFAGQKKEWHILIKIRELKRLILKKATESEDLYYFFADDHRDVFWQDFSDEIQYRRLMGLLVVARHIKFTEHERAKFLVNLNRRSDFLYR